MVSSRSAVKRFHFDRLWATLSARLVREGFSDQVLLESGKRVLHLLDELGNQTQRFSGNKGPLRLRTWRSAIEHRGNVGCDGVPPCPWVAQRPTLP